MITDTIPHNGSDTSVEAAETIEEHLPRLERTVLEVIVQHDGATCDEVETHTSLAHQTASARIRGLAKRGVVHDSGMRRPTRSGRRAIVWKAQPL